MQKGYRILNREVDETIIFARVFKAAGESTWYRTEDQSMNPPSLSSSFLFRCFQTSWKRQCIKLHVNSMMKLAKAALRYPPGQTVLAEGFGR